MTTHIDVWALPLTSTQKLVLLAICSQLGDNETGTVRIDDICGMTSLSRDGVFRALRVMERASFIRRKEQAGRASQFKVRRSS